MIKNCKNCNNWKLVDRPKDEDYIDWCKSKYIGRCQRIKHSGDESGILLCYDNENDKHLFDAGVYDYDDYDGGLLTNENFSCSLWNITVYYGI